jgi:dienelactone hydrolase
MRFFTSFLAFFGGSIAMAMVLPDDFTLQPETEGPPTLIWSSNDTVVHMGASRPEFCRSDGSLFGYPRQVHGQLQLTLNTEQLTALHTPTNLTLQVKTGGGRRVLRRARRSAVTVNSTTPSFPTPTVPTDPAKRGIYEIRRDSYELAGIVLEKYPVPVEVLAEVTDTPDAPGPRPLVLFLHGRHETCYQGGPGGSSTGEWPCPEGWLPIPSYKGFRYITEILASQGYIVVSISANGIDAQDYLSADRGTSSRSQLIRYHLSLWAQWHVNGKYPWGSRFQGRVNMNQIVLVGHSRGGEGVHRAAIDATSTDPYKIVGLVAYAPTAYGHQVTPDVHSATILPTCDGDVYELPGQTYIDYSRDIAYSEALRTAVISLGSNHNFFNTE